MNGILRSFGITSVALMLTFSSNANAQSALAQKVEARLTAAVQKVQDACSNELTQYCKSVTPGEGRVLFCMMAHEDKISPKCDLALYEASRNMERALDRLGETADACWGDIEKQCSNVQEGDGRIAQCLLSKKTSLSQACASAIDKLPTAK